MEREGRPLLSAAELAADRNVSQHQASDALARLAADGDLSRLDVSGTDAVWYPADLDAMAARERVVVFPDRREVVIDAADQFTRARLATFAHLVTTNGEGGAVYEIRPEDVWSAPADSLEELLATMQSVLGEDVAALAEWVSSQYERAHSFRLYTHDEGYTVLAAESDDLMGNVARPAIDDDALRAPIADDESWVNEEYTAQIKRTLYDAGYPVQDDRNLAVGEPLDVELRLELRDYQEEWRERFLEQGSGVFVGPPGSGKTVAALGVLAAVGGETLILVPSRELASQWHEELLAHTTLQPAQVGEYHGGQKDIRPVTIATYRTAGMDRHRTLFEERAWGLIVYDEVHHIPAPIFRRSASLQSKHRLGLTATPTRESDDEAEIFTLVGPPIGTDWGRLFDAGHVQAPAVEIRLVPWGTDEEADAYGATGGRDRRRIAAENSAKATAVERLVTEEFPEATALVFVEYLDHGEALADALDVPFVSGETPHARRESYFQALRDGERDLLVVSRVGDEGIDLPGADLAIVASGLGGSRRQGTQRAGRTMRPTGDARLVTLATQGTREEDFVRQQTRHLAAKGVAVSEHVVSLDDDSESGEGSSVAAIDDPDGTDDVDGTD